MYSIWNKALVYVGTISWDFRPSLLEIHPENDCKMTENDRKWLKLNDESFSEQPKDKKRFFLTIPNMFESHWIFIAA